MAANRRAENALNELGAALGTPLAFDENSVITLEFAGDMTCSIEAPNDADRVFFHALVLRVPFANREQVLQDALALNLFNLSIAGSAVAFDRETNGLVLCYSVPADTLEPERLSRIVEEIVSEVQRLRKTITEGGEHSVAHPGSEGDQDFLNFVRV
jgi:hypothetical protein